MLQGKEKDGHVPSVVEVPVTRYKLHFGAGMLVIERKEAQLPLPMHLIDS
jgi:hypothetical protein